MTVFPGYETCDLEHPRANAEFYRVYDEVLGPYWSPRRKLVEAKYKGLEPEQSDDGFVAVERSEGAPVPLTTG